MSTDYTAYTILGVKTTKDHLYNNTKKRGCDHTGNNVDLDAKFCKSCGKSVWLDDSQPIPGYNGSDKLNELDVVQITEEETVYIGYIIGRSRSYNGKPECSKLDIFILDVKDRFKDYPFFDNDAFGIWTVMNWG